MFDVFIDVGASDQGGATALRGESLAIYFTMFDALMDVFVSSRGGDTALKG